MVKHVRTKKHNGKNEAKRQKERNSVGRLSKRMFPKRRGNARRLQNKDGRCFPGGRGQRIAQDGLQKIDQCK